MSSAMLLEWLGLRHGRHPYLDACGVPAAQATPTWLKENMPRTAGRVLGLVPQRYGATA